MYHIIEVFRNKHAGENFASKKGLCMNENLAYRRVLNFMNLMELKITYLFKTDISGRKQDTTLTG